MPSPGPIHSISVLRAVLLILSRARLLKRGFSLMRHAVEHFFLPQFETLLMPWLRPVAVLSHPLDSCIPFRPREVQTYLGYVSFWLKTQRFLFDRFGQEALPEIRSSFEELCLLYSEAGSIYRRCQSTTTTREALPFHPFFAAIYLLDPHLHCIPSLHILLICYNYFKTNSVLRKLEASGEDNGRLLLEVEAEALRVTEAILLVKQHSIMDIAPSLFLLSTLFEGFAQEAAEAFIDRLFTGWSLEQSEKERLRSIVRSSYRELTAEYAASFHKDRQKPVLSFLQRFTPGVILEKRESA